MSALKKKKTSTFRFEAKKKPEANSTKRRCQISLLSVSAYAGNLKYFFFSFPKANVCLGFRSFFCCCFTVSPCGLGNFSLLFFRSIGDDTQSSHGLRPQPQFLHFHSIEIFLFKNKRSQIETFK